MSRRECANFPGGCPDSGEGRWTSIAAIDEGVPAPVLTAALYSRFGSRNRDEFADKALSATRKQFGGHDENRTGPAEMAKPIAVLFDIDGTLVHTGGAGARSWAWAFDQRGARRHRQAHLGRGNRSPGRSGDLPCGAGRDPSYDEMARLYAKYLWRLSEEIWTSQAYRVLDGAEDLLQRLTDAGIILGVVSGAMEGAARTKMNPAAQQVLHFRLLRIGLPDRTEVTGLGIAKAARLHGQDLSPEQVYVVGDTPRDVAAGRAAGATAIGVASGNYGVDELRAAQADHVLWSLTEPFPSL